MRTSILLCLVLGGVAVADVTVHGDDAARARLLYESAIKHYNIGEFAEAIHDFEAVYRLRPDPVILFNIGQCHRMLGDRKNAAVMYRNFLRGRPDTPKRAAVEELLALVEKGPAPSPSPARR